MRCELCGEDRYEGKSFAVHLQVRHGMKTEEYTWKHLLKLDTRPSCAVTGCIVPVRYVAFTFKKYCKEHSSLAEAEAGRVGGKIKKQWNKGKTVLDDTRIVQSFGAANHFFGKHHSAETIDSISASKRISEIELNERIKSSKSAKYFKLVSTYSEYKSWQDYLRFHCVFCGRETERSLMDLERGTRCHECFPQGSIPEQEIADYVRSLCLEVVQNTRKVISPKELDIWIPEKNVGIEFHGLYWHSGGIDHTDEYTKTMHREKYDSCKEKGIRLVQFFSDEWRDHRDVCQSMISNRLGKNSMRIGARECELRELAVEERRVFFETSHIAGDTRSSICFGLVKGGEVISAMSFRIPIQKKHGNVCEIARFATKLFTQCPGNAGRLLKAGKAWAQSKGFEGIMTYADLRFGEGKAYEKAGFSYVGDSGLSYFYTDGKNRFDRFKYRAQDSLTEKDYAVKMSVRPVWACGNAVYVLKF